MFVIKQHMEILLKIGGSTTVDNLTSTARLPRNRVLKNVMELHVMGLVNREGDIIRVTGAGEILIDAWKLAGEREFEDPWLNSAIIYALHIGASTGYLPNEWVKLLEPRGLTFNGEVVEAGKYVIESYRKARPLIYITPEIAEFLTGLPDGPAFYDALVSYRDSMGFGNNVIHALEASRIIKISPPIRGKATYVVTQVGRKVKDALMRIPLYSSVILIDEKTVEALEKDYLEEWEERRFEDLNLRHGRKITDAGRSLIEGFAAQTASLSRILPIHLTREDVEVLKTVSAFSSKEAELCVIEKIKEESGIGDAAERLHMLEAVGLLRRLEVKGRDTYALTEEGKEVVKKFGELGKDISSDAVKACSYALSGEPPSPQWVEKAKELGLVSLDITGRGEYLLYLSSRMRRVPFLMYHEAYLLHIMPAKGMPLEDAVRKVGESLGKPSKEVRRFFGYAEFKGYLEILPNDYIVMTDLGKIIKDVITLGKTKELIKARISITPTMFKVLHIINSNIKELRKVWSKGDAKRVVNEEAAVIYNNLKGITSVSLEEIKKAVTMLRGFGLLGRTGITEAGTRLLFLGELLQKMSSELRRTYFSEE